MMAINGNRGRAFDKSKRWGAMGVKLLVLVLGLTTTGCSFLWVTRPLPPEKARDEYGTLSSCTSSYVTPVLDTTVLACSATMGMIELPSNKNSASDKITGLAIFGPMGAAALASAIYGYYYVAKCKKQRPATPIAESSVAPRSLYGQATPPLPSPVQVRGKRLAVLEFQGKNLDPDILMTFSDAVRGGALQGLDPYGVVVMTRENIQVRLRDMGKQECGEGDCEIETARNMGADYVITGKVVRMEQLYVVVLKLHETQIGSLLGTGTVDGASQVELMRSLRERGRQLTSAAFGPGPAPQ